MKRSTVMLFVVSLAILPVQGIVAQDVSLDKANREMAASMGMEFNMNSRDNFAGAFIFGFDYNLPVSDVRLATGLTFSISNNFFGITVLEPVALIRWYFKEIEHMELFAQIDLGTFIVLEKQGASTLFLGGLRSGFRLPLGEMLYIEPFGRLGYPFAFGFGASAGVRF